MVEIDASSTRPACSCMRMSPSASVSSRAVRRWRSSSAAARVKVTMRKDAMSAPPEIRLRMRSTSTVVLPEPAAALTSRLPCRCSMTRR